jgi:hypothetical protein
VSEAARDRKLQDLDPTSHSDRAGSQRQQPSSGLDHSCRSGTGQPRDWARMTPDTTNNSETLRQIAIKSYTSLPIQECTRCSVRSRSTVGQSSAQPLKRSCAVGSPRLESLLPVMRWEVIPLFRASHIRRAICEVLRSSAGSRTSVWSSKMRRPGFARPSGRVSGPGHSVFAPGGGIPGS